MAKYYTLEVHPSLFGDFALVRRWGRLGRSGKMRIDLYETRDLAEKAQRRLMRSKLVRGYDKHG